ncbi:maleylacetate reductase [Martelella soudanensis]|uniref:maleylacetate reductase n=1 Tax=unclassified Martelella TaxID=2629616 RepID=UPI001FF05ED4|nr:MULTISPECIES: maleylacetate reductase [unclassified Martelella]
MSTIDDFVFKGIPTRVLFGTGTLSRARDEVEKLGGRAALVLSTAHQSAEADRLVSDLGELAAGRFSEAAMHTPTDVTAKALEIAKSTGADCVVSIGGGSTIGLGKAISIRTGMPHLAIPTTYAGSEMTDILGETENGNKTTRRDPAIRPDTVIYDVSLTLSLPEKLTVSSALNAAAHAVEALYAPDGNPVISQMAAAGLAALHRGLPRIIADSADHEGRRETLYGAWLCATVLGQAAMGLHHKLCHVLGGSFNLPHSETHAILLPHTAGFNAMAAKTALKPASDIFGDPLGGGLWDFAKAAGAPLALADFGFSAADIPRAAEIAGTDRYDNPRAFDTDDIARILTAALHGDRPETF